MSNSLRKFLAICFFLNFSIIYKLQAEVAIKEEYKSIQSERLNYQEKKVLLKIARNTLKSIVRHNVVPKISSEDLKNLDEFNRKSGVFVTLKKRGVLRGCIGNIFPNRIMFEAVTKNTVNSALFDRRFIPVGKDELDDIDIEISILSNIEKINGYEVFDVEKHGIIISKGSASAVFLPQVAREQRWNRDETLSHLCIKAGLPKDAWKDDEMVFYVFTADVFKESDFY